MAKMCKYWSVTTAGGQMCEGSHFPRKGSGCPRNTNSRCQIIPSREKMVRVKAWGFYYVDMEGKKRVFANEVEKGVMQVKKFPCTILISAKYLKGGKK